MKLLITGVTGFIGQNLVKKLLENEIEVHAIVREESDLSSVDTKVKLFYYDQDVKKLIDYTKNENFDGIVHLASLFLATHSLDDIFGLINSNITLGVHLLEAAKESNIKWFINTGTFWQHYNNEEYNPVNLYAATKEAFEVMSKYYIETSDIIFTTLKLNDTFGPEDTRNKVFNLWNEISKTGEILEMSAGEQYIDISYIEDVVEAYFILIIHLNSSKAKKFHNETFVVTQEQRMKLKELSIIFEQATETTLNINWSAREYREREVMSPWNKGKTVPGWKQQFSLEKAINKTVGKKI